MSASTRRLAFGALAAAPVALVSPPIGASAAARQKLGEALQRHEDRLQHISDELRSTLELVRGGRLVAPDPHLAWWEERDKIYKELARLDEAGEDDSHIGKRHIVLEDLICQTPARTPAGVLLQLELIGEWHTDEDFNGMPSPAALRNAIATMRGLAGDMEIASGGQTGAAA